MERIWIRSGKGLTLETSAFKSLLLWRIHIMNSVAITKLTCNTLHRHRTTVSLETYPFIHLLKLSLCQMFFHEKKTNKNRNKNNSAQTQLKGGKRVNTKRMDHPSHLYESTVITATETNPCKTKSNSRWHSYKHRFYQIAFFCCFSFIFCMYRNYTFFLYLMLNAFFTFRSHYFKCLRSHRGVS